MVWERGAFSCGRVRVLHAVGEGGSSLLWEREGLPCCGRGSFLLWEREGPPCCERGRVFHAVGEGVFSCGRGSVLLWERECSPVGEGVLSMLWEREHSPCLWEREGPPCRVFSCERGRVIAVKPLTPLCTAGQAGTRRS